MFGQQPEQLEPLSQIIRELNEKFGTDVREKDKVVIRQLEERLSAHASLADSIRVNTAENARLTFESVVTDQLQDLANTNFEFYKRETDHQAFARHFLNWNKKNTAHGKRTSAEACAKHLREAIEKKK